MTAPIEVLAIRRLDGRTSVKAFVDLRIGGVTIKGAKVVRQDGQQAWLAMPAVKLERGWNNVVELSKPLRERVTEVVLAAWEGQRQEIIPPSRPRQDPRQAAVDEWAARFDERGPDQEPGF